MEDLTNNTSQDTSQEVSQEIKNKPKVFYIYDPMCGWCYGFSKIMTTIKAKYANYFDFEIYSGGMIIGDGVKPAYEMSSYILNAYKRVEQMSGVKFGDKYLNIFKEGSYILNSETACIALTAIKEIKPEIAFDFATEIQSAHFKEGQSLNAFVTFENIANKFGINLIDFNNIWTNKAIYNKTFEEFEFVKKLGVRGFPAVLLLSKGQYYSVASGFTIFSQLDSVFQSIIENYENIK